MCRTYTINKSSQTSSSSLLTKLISFIPIIGDHYATTIKQGNNKYGKYATIKPGNSNYGKCATNNEVDQDIEEVEDDHNLQITSKLNLTGKFETTPIYSAWVGPTKRCIQKINSGNIENDNENEENQFAKGYYCKHVLPIHYIIIKNMALIN